MPRSRYGTTDWITGPTMVNAVRSRTPGRMPTTVNSIAFGIDVLDRQDAPRPA